MVTVAQLLERAKQEYLEMPGLMLTTHQASRLWGLDLGMCEALLSALVHEKFLSQTNSGAYLRRGSEVARIRSNAMKSVTYRTFSR